MSWIYEGELIEEIEPNMFGFVYLIKNKLNNKQYIGKKQFTFKKTKKIKGKTKRVIVESDWKSYWSSSDELKKDVELLGQENFERKILKFCKSKSECSYFEIKYQLEYDVLLYPDQWYNKWVSCKINSRQLASLHNNGV